MGGFVQGFLGALGDRARQSHILDLNYNHQANEEVAQQLEKMAENARPEFAPEYLQMALRYRSLKPGQKPGKDMNLHDIMLRQVQQAHQQELAQQAGQAQPQANLNRLTPPPAPDTAATGPQQGFQPGTPEYEAAHKAFPTAMNPTVTSGPASNPGPALSQLPPQWSGPVPGGDQNLPPPPQFIGKPNMPGGGNATSGSPNMVAGGAAPSSGFGVSLPAPPNYNYSRVPNTPEGAGMVSLPDGSTALSTRYLPEELNQRDINFTTGKQHAINQEMGARMRETAQFNRQLQNQTISDRIDALKSSGAWDKLSPRQQAELQIGANQITPELRPLNLSGETLGNQITATEDVNGQPINPNGFYKELYTPNGIQYRPIVGPTMETLNPDSSSPTGFSKVATTKTGQELGRARGVLPPSAFVPTQTTSSHGVVHDIVDPETGDIKTGVVNVGSSSTHQKIIPGVTPGTTPPFVAQRSLPPPPGRGRAGTAGTSTSTPRMSTGGPAPTRATTPTFKKGGSIPGVRVLGESPAQRKMEIQNPLNTDAQKIMEDTDPVLDKVNQALKMLEPTKDDNSPYHTFFKNLEYKFGMANDATPLITNLNLGQVVGGARILKGSSRAYQMLVKAMEHLPDTSKDSPKLMYEKLVNIKDNLEKIKQDAAKYGQRYPGLKRPPSMAAPPSDTVRVISPDGRTGTIPAEKLQDALKRGFKQAQ